MDEPGVGTQQTCGNLLAGVGPFAVERGLIPAGESTTTARIRLVNTGDRAVATFSTPQGQVDYDGGSLGCPRLALGRFAPAAKLPQSPGVPTKTVLEKMTCVVQELGAVRDIDPCSGHRFDDTRRYVETAVRERLQDQDGELMTQLQEGNATRVYPRLAQWL